MGASIQHLVPSPCEFEASSSRTPARKGQALKFHVIRVLLTLRSQGRSSVASKLTSDYLNTICFASFQSKQQSRRPPHSKLTVVGTVRTCCRYVLGTSAVAHCGFGKILKPRLDFVDSKAGTRDGPAPV
jgi:hypothetical protein